MFNWKKFLKKYISSFSGQIHPHYEIQSVRRNDDGELFFYCKEDIASKTVFTISGKELVFRKKEILDKFSIEDKIKIISMVVTQKSNLIITEIHSSTVIFPFLAMFFGACLVISNIVSQKLVPFLGFTITGGDVIYILTYVLGDIITEVYGYKKSRQLIWGTVVINLIAFLSYKLAIILPSSPFWHDQEAFKLILNTSNRIVIASLLAYCLSEFVNSYIVARVKVLTHGRKIWLRITMASICAITIDNFCFMFIAYYGEIPVYEIVKSSWFEYGLSLLVEFLCIPLIVYLSTIIKNHEKIDTVDVRTNFTPFSLDGKYDQNDNIYNKDLKAI